MKPEPTSRPANIPTTAVWDETPGEYCDVPELDGKRHGRARWYRADGSLACESGYEHGVEEGPYTRYHPGGDISQVGTMHRDKIHGEVCWTRGPAESPEATVPPQCGTNVVGVRQVHEHGVPYPGHFFDGEDNEVLPDGSSLPARPQGVPPEAAFDPQDGRWFLGLGSGGFEQRDGKWSWWTSEGTRAQETEYERGTQLTERKFHDDGSLFVERIKDAQGRELRTAYFYTDGDLNHSTDNSYEGDTLVGVEIHKYRYDLRAKAAREDGEMGWEWFDTKGSSQARGQVVDEEAVGAWTFIDEGKTYNLDLSGRELSADVDEDFDPLGLLGTALLAEGTDEPVPDVLAGVGDIQWAQEPSCYGETGDFARYLGALVSEVPAVRRAALGEVYSETLHQGTVYVVTARVIPFVVRSMAHPNADLAALVEYVYDVTSSAAPYREQALEWDEDGDDRRAVLGVLGATRELFPQIAAAATGDEEELTLNLLGLAEYGGEAGKALLTETLEGGSLKAQAIAGWSLLEFDDATTAEAAALLSHEQPLVRCCAALAAARMQGRQPEGTVSALLAALAAVRDLESDFAELPFAELPLVVFLSLSLGNFATEQAQTAVTDLLSHQGRIGWADRPPYYRGLFSLCFSRGEPPFAADFPKVFEVVAGDVGLDGFVNFSEVARMWNLPTDFREYGPLRKALESAEDRDAEMVRRFFAPDDES